LFGAPENLEGKYCNEVKEGFAEQISVSMPTAFFRRPAGMRTFDNRPGQHQFSIRAIPQSGRVGDAMACVTSHYRIEGYCGGSITYTEQSKKTATTGCEESPASAFAENCAGERIMLEILPESHGNLLAVRCSKKLTEKDYEEVLIPRLEALINEHSKARFMFYMDKDFEGWEFDAAIHYAKFGIKHRQEFEKVAAVGGPKWVNWGMKVQSFLVPGEVRTFSCDEGELAKRWIES
jgi:hypothetical protein